MIFSEYNNALPDDCFLIFTTPNCPSCHELLNNIQDLDASLPVYCLSGQNAREVGAQFNIFSAPTTIKVIDGKEDDRFMGSRNINFVTKFFN